MIGSWLLPIPFFTSFKLEFLGVKVVTDFFGALMVVGSLMFGLFIIKFEMQLFLLFLGRAFGK